MGTQNTSLRMAGILSVFTTHMTGAVSGLSEELIVCAFTLLRRRNRSKESGFASATLRSQHPQAFRNIARSAALLAGFLGGALLGATLAHRLGVTPAMAVPLVLLAGIGVFD
jgi:uncharacterized membrane protein YoaK (UPF0700 family)